VRYRGATHALACNEFAGGTIAPRGYQRLADFHLEGTIPVWTYAMGDALLELRIWMAHGHNTTHVQYRLLQAATALGLEITPLCNYRIITHTHAAAGPSASKRGIRHARLPRLKALAPIPCRSTVAFSCRIGLALELPSSRGGRAGTGQR